MLPAGWRWPAMLILIAVVSAASAWLVTAPRSRRTLQVLVVASSPPASTARSAQIAGAVVHPGIYPIAAGTRLADLLSAAGGATENADTSRLNLARRIADGERVDVPLRNLSPASGLVRLNRATRGQLLALPGMTEQAARAIEDSVHTRGPIASAEDLAARHIVSASLIDAIGPLLDWSP